MLRYPTCALVLLLLLSAIPAAGQQAAGIRKSFDSELLQEELGAGQEAMREGDDETAIDHLTRALQIADLPQPERAQVHNLRGRALLRLGRQDKAMLDFHRAIRLDATVPDSWYQRGALRARLGELESALKDLSEALRLDPGLEPGHQARARVLVDLGRMDEALAALDAALGLDNRNPETHLERGRLNLIIGEPWEAFRDFTRVLQLDPDHPEALLDRGRASFFLGKFAAAAADFRAAWERRQEDPESGLWFRIAALRSGVGDPAEVDLDADEDSIWPGPILALFDGRLEDQELLVLAGDRDPAAASLHLSQARFFLAQRDLITGQSELAAARLRRVLQDGPKSSAAFQGARAELARLAAGS